MKIWKYVRNLISKSDFSEKDNNQQESDRINKLDEQNGSEDEKEDSSESNSILAESSQQKSEDSSELEEQENSDDKDKDSSIWDDSNHENDQSESTDTDELDESIGDKEDNSCSEEGQNDDKQESSETEDATESQEQENSEDKDISSYKDSNSENNQSEGTGTDDLEKKDSSESINDDSHSSETQDDDKQESNETEDTTESQEQENSEDKDISSYKDSNSENSQSEGTGTDDLENQDGSENDNEDSSSSETQDDDKQESSETEDTELEEQENSEDKDSASDNDSNSESNKSEVTDTDDLENQDGSDSDLEDDKQGESDSEIFQEDILEEEYDSSEQEQNIDSDEYLDKIKDLRDKLLEYALKKEDEEKRKRQLEKSHSDTVSDDIFESDEEEYELSEHTNRFLDSLKELPSFKDRSRGPGYGIDTEGYTEVSDSIIRTLITKFLNRRFCKKNTDLNVRSNSLEKARGFYRWEVKDVITHLETHQVTKVLNDKYGYEYANGRNENVPLSFYFDMSVSMSKYTNLLAVIAIELLKKNVKVLIGFNEKVNVQIDSIKDNVDVAELAKLLETAGYSYYNSSSAKETLSKNGLFKFKYINENLDNYLINKRAEKCVVFSDFDPFTEVCNLSNFAEVYWFCFEDEFNREDAGLFHGFIYPVQDEDDIASGLIKVNDNRFEALCFTENPKEFIKGKE